MACYHPSHVTIDRKTMAGSAPRRDSVKVPCGTCIGCRSDQGRDWAIRLMHESTQTYPSFFITLTYDEQNLPGQWPDDERPRGTLSPDDLSVFFKRLRKSSSLPVRYYACGEYGSSGDRPHYHAALFGMRLLDRTQIGTRKGYPVFRSATLEKAWGNGSTEITSLSWKSASYVAGYVQKKARTKANPTNHLRVCPDSGEIVELCPEFARMSRRPGIGKKWLEKYWQDVYPRDFVFMDGTPFKPPRYYDKLMEDINPTLMEEVRYQRWKDAEEIGDEKLIMAEKIHRSRLKLFGRTDDL